MWGFGGRYYWGTRMKETEKVEGIVVVFAWMSSQDKHLKNYVDLYSSLGWNSLVCHSQFLNLFFPEKATALAFEILNELIKELKMRPCPVVLASFSGGPKACMYKMLQIIDGRSQSLPKSDEYKLVKDCICGHIYDSTPIDFKSDMGMRFILHPTVLQMSSPPSIVKWIVNSISSSLDTLFLTKFESQRADYWQTLYSSVSMGAPYLIFCSEDDDLAPWHVILNFAQRLEALGGDVKMVKWNRSSHVGHYRNYPIEYSAAVTELLGKSSTIYSQRIRQLEGEERMGFDSSHDEEHGPFQSLKKATKNANQIVRRVALGSNDHFVVPTSVEYHDGKAVGSVEDGERGGFIQLTNLPRINAHGVLGQILYDVCVPKNVEDWDVKDSSNFSMAPFPNLSRRNYMNPIKCIRKSRL